MKAREVLTAALVGLVATACGSSAPGEDDHAGATVSSDVLSLAPEVVERGDFEVLTVARAALEESLSVTGRIQLDEDRTARVGSPADGRVSRIHVALGDVVEAGAPLLELHSHELIVARADYTKAMTTLSTAERRLRIARTENDRAERLLTAKALSDRERLAAESELAGAESEWERAKSELARAEHYLEHLGMALDDDVDRESGGDLTIRAPVSGVVLERQVTLGTVVSPTDDLVLLSDISSLWVVAEVPEREASRVRSGQKAAVTVAAFPDEPFEAQVFHIAEQLDPQLRTVLVRGLLDNPERRLRPGMYAAVRIALGEAEPVVAVPERAIQLLEGEQVVFVALDSNRFERRFVRTGRAVAGSTEIVDGLAEGERVVGSGSFLIKSEFLRGDFAEEEG